MSTKEELSEQQKCGELVSQFQEETSNDLMLLLQRLVVMMKMMTYKILNHDFKNEILEAFPVRRR